MGQIQRRRNLLMSTALLVAVSWSQQASAQLTNFAAAKPIIDGSGAWNNEPFTGGNFPASRVTDGNTNEATGAAESYWLGREGLLGEYFTLDLGESLDIDRIDLFNTHNRQFNDRGTDEFVLLGALTVDDSNQLVDPFLVLSGNLSNVNFQDNILADSFPLPSVVNTRYLRFEGLTAINPGDNVGLNEIQVFNTNFVSPNKAFGKPVIAGSGAFPDLSFDAGSFPATRVTDGSTDDGGNYWLGREGVAGESFTLDLEEVVSIEEILLRNTHNSGSIDRGTMDFRILASQSVDAGNALVDPVEILTGKLGNTAGVSPLLETVFTAANGLTPVDARYLQFEAISSTYFNDNVGLNEIEVYDEVMHEPTAAPRDNVALGKPVIDGSGAWNDVAFDEGEFPAARVSDGSVADANTGRNSYWLGREFTDDEYFTLDLGEVFTIDEIVLRNTHNTQFNDRGTEEFVILGATEVDENNQLVDLFPVVSGTLANTFGQTVITPEVFGEGNDGFFGGDARYLQFRALTHYSGANNGGAGLNEIEVFGSLASERLLGDINGDLTVDRADVTQLAAGHGDEFGLPDLALLQANFGRTISPAPSQAAVPEPSAMLLMQFVALGLLGYRWRRRPFFVRPRGIR